MKKLTLSMIAMILLAVPAFGQSYEVDLTTSATTTGTDFRPHDGDFRVKITGTWTGGVQIQSYDPVNTTWDDLDSEFTSNADVIINHVGGPNWRYRAIFATPTSGAPTVIMMQR